MPDSTAEINKGERFAFGNNWRAFIDLVDDDRIQAAADSLLASLGTTDLSGCTFLDIGCGSGLFSLAAHRLGAQVHSFDFDPESVAAAIELRRRFAPDTGWTVEQGSILDAAYVKGLGQYDIVYSWGVLHHTGGLWDAVAAAADIVLPGGLLYISVYNDQGLESRIWRRVKRRYNGSGPLMRGLLVAGSSAYLHRRRPVAHLIRLLRLVRGGQPGRDANAPGPRERGMSAKHDLIDWVGGYPFEVATPEAVFSFVRQRGFELRYLKTRAGGLGCNEYVFERVRESAAP